MSSPMPRKKVEQESPDTNFPSVLSIQTVSCPMLSKFETLVNVSYCINKCEFYDKLEGTDTDSSPGNIICKFPRKIKIYPVAG